MPTGNPGVERRARPGRPSELTRVVATRTVKTDAGEQLVDVTVGERILDGIRTGLSLEDVASRERITVRTFYRWRRDGLDAQRDLATGTRIDDELTDYEAECVEFCQSLEQAEAEGKLALFGQTQRLAMGGLPNDETHEDWEPDPTPADPGRMKLVKRRIVRRTTLPSEAMLRWRIDRRWPGAPARVEVTGADGGPVQVEQRERAESLADTLERFLARQDEEAAAVERANRAEAARRRRAKAKADG